MQNLNFTWKVAEFTQKYMKIVLNFQNAMFVSTNTDLDSIIVSIIDTT